MVQIIDDEYAGSISGRIGKGFGKGLADQLPKEIERYRLSSGLEALNKDKNLSPMEYYTKALSIPGVIDRPEVVRQLRELSTNQNIRDRFANRSEKRIGQPISKETDQENQKFFEDKLKIPNETQQKRPLPTQIIGEGGSPQVNPNNPTRQEAIPRVPDTASEFQDRVAYHLELDPQATLDQARTRAVQDMERDLARPLGEQEQDKYLKEQQKQIRKEFKRQSERKLQKLDQNIYSDISGDMLNEAERKVDRMVATTKNLSVNDAVNKVTDELLDFAKAKKGLSVLANRDLSEKILPNKRSQTSEKLNSYQKIYDKWDRNEEFFNYLTTNTKNDGFNLSPENAAWRAYPPKWDPGLSSFLNNVKPSKSNEAAANSRGYAIQVEPYLNHPKASILSIAHELREKDPYFDENYFFNQIREDQERLKLDDRLERELGMAGSYAFPNWGDIWIRPEGKKMTFTLKRPKR